MAFLRISCVPAQSTNCGIDDAVTRQVLTPTGALGLAPHDDSGGSVALAEVFLQVRWGGHWPLPAADLEWGRGFLRYARKLTSISVAHFVRVV